jgi:Tol biopolymer transport system component
MMWAGVCGVLLLALLFAVQEPRQTRDLRVRRFAFALTEELGTAQISPDGNHVVYILGQPPETTLWVQDLDRREPRRLEGTEGAQRPFWSPDSGFIGYWAGWELCKISVRGGPAVKLCEIPERLAKSFVAPWGAWSPDGQSIVFSAGTRGIYETPARGGAPTLLIGPDAMDSEVFYGTTHVLGRAGSAVAVLFDTWDARRGQIVLHQLESGQQRVLATGGRMGRPVYSDSGHVLYSEGPSRTVFAIPFSSETLQPIGDAFPVAPNARTPSVAGDGTLVYCDSTRRQSHLVVRDRNGRHVGVVGQPEEELYFARLSPDEQRVLVLARGRDGTGLWVHEVDRPVKRALPLDPLSPLMGVWSPDGDQIAVTAKGPDTGRDIFGDVFITSLSGGSETVPIVATPTSEYIGDWSPDGHHLIIGKGNDLWRVTLSADDRPPETVVFRGTSAKENVPQFSPDGRFVVYLSDESGRPEVYVERFPEGGDRLQVSTGGGCQPRWGTHGEVFYVELVETGGLEIVPDNLGTLVSVPVETAPTLSAGSPTRLFSSPGLTVHETAVYDVFADGKRFLIPEPIGEPPPPVIRVVQNWYVEFSGHETGSKE